MAVNGNFAVSVVDHDIIAITAAAAAAGILAPIMFAVFIGGEYNTVIAGNDLCAVNARFGNIQCAVIIHATPFVKGRSQISEARTRPYIFITVAGYDHYITAFQTFQFFLTLFFFLLPFQIGFPGFFQFFLFGLVILLFVLQFLLIGHQAFNQFGVFL